MVYTKVNLKKNYLWIYPHDPDISVLNNQVLDKKNGYEILATINIFLEMFLPEHSLADFHKAERLMEMVPKKIKYRKDAVYWLSKNYNLINIAIPLLSKS